MNGNLVEVVNRTRVPVDAGAVAALVGAVLAAEGVYGAEIGVAFVGDGRMRALNREHRGLDRVTDGLSFPLEAADELVAWRELEAAPPGDVPPRLLGDVVVGARQALRQARAHDVPPAFELALLLVHGVLHVLGHDHETDAGGMALRQGELLAALDWERLLGPAS
ncbi:MAG TPA: rRNA maturation RNase YbeY [Thermoleophilia bacterium]|nr:rRNA maturation RNase YbeY [Thermoleophilia bacterium]